MCYIKIEHRITLQNVKELKEQVNHFVIGSYGSLMALLTEKYSKIVLMKSTHESPIYTEKVKNPLTN
jgi:hypothetical protein